MRNEEWWWRRINFGSAAEIKGEPFGQVIILQILFP